MEEPGAISKVQYRVSIHNETYVYIHNTYVWCSLRIKQYIRMYIYVHSIVYMLYINTFSVCVCLYNMNDIRSYTCIQ